MMEIQKNKSSCSDLSTLSVESCHRLLRYWRRLDDAEHCGLWSVNVHGKVVSKSSIVEFDQSPYFFIKLKDESNSLFVNIAVRGERENDNLRKLQEHLCIAKYYCFTNLKFSGMSTKEQVLNTSRDTCVVHMRSSVDRKISVDQWATENGVRLADIPDYLSLCPDIAEHSFAICTQLKGQITDATQACDGLYTLGGNIKLYVTAVPGLDCFQIFHVGNFIKVSNVHDYRKVSNPGGGYHVVAHACLHSSFEVTLAEPSDHVPTNNMAYDYRKSALYKMLYRYDLGARHIESLVSFSDELVARFQLQDRREFRSRLLLTLVKSAPSHLRLYSQITTEPKRDLLSKFCQNLCESAKCQMPDLLASYPRLSVACAALSAECRQVPALSGAGRGSLEWRLLDSDSLKPNRDIVLLGRLTFCAGRLCLEDSSASIPCIVSSRHNADKQASHTSDNNKDRASIGYSRQPITDKPNSRSYIQTRDLNGIFRVERFQYVVEVLTSESGEINEYSYIQFSMNDTLKLLDFTCTNLTAKYDSTLRVTILSVESLVFPTASNETCYFCVTATELNNEHSLEPMKRLSEGSSTCSLEGTPPTNRDNCRKLLLIFEHRAACWYNFIQPGMTYLISGRGLTGIIPILLQSKIEKLGGAKVLRYQDVKIENLDATQNQTNVKDVWEIKASSGDWSSVAHLRGIVVSKRLHWVESGSAVQVIRSQSILTLTLRDLNQPEVLHCEMNLTNQLYPYSLLSGTVVRLSNVSRRQGTTLLFTSASSLQIIELTPSDSQTREQVTEVNHWGLSETYFWSLWWSPPTGSLLRRTVSVRVVLEMNLYVRCTKCGVKVRRNLCGCGRGCCRLAMFADATLMVDDKTSLAIVHCSGDCVQKLLRLDDHNWSELETRIADDEEIICNKDTRLEEEFGLSQLIVGLCKGAILCTDWDMVLQTLPCAGRKSAYDLIHSRDSNVFPLRKVRRCDVTITQRQFPYLRFTGIDVRLSV